MNCKLDGARLIHAVPKRNDTGKRLFLFMLKHARRLKYDLGFNWKDRRNYLMGIKCTFTFLYEDFRIADNMRDFWKCQSAGHTLGRD